MKTIRFSVALIALFIMFLPEVLSARPNPIPELEAIRQDVSMLNLLRGLYLSKDQASQLLILAQKAEACREAVRTSAEADKKQIISAFSELREALFEEPGHEKQAQDKAKTIDHRIKEAVGNAADKIADLEEQVDKILTGAQRSIVEDFKPCLIPPKDLRNPVRVGQAGAEAGIMGKVADLIHSTPPDIWKERSSHLFDKLSNRLEQESGSMSPAMKADVRKRLETVAEKIRQTSDVDYSLKGTELASELLVINPKKALKQGHKKTGDLAKWFLSEASIRVLPRWIQQLDKPTSTEKSNVEEDLPEEGSIQELGAKAMMMVNRMYRQRKNVKGLGPLEDLTGPIKKAIDDGERKKLVTTTLSALDSLVAVKADVPIARAMVQLCRQLSRSLEIPLMNPEQDPYGYAEEIKSYINQNDPAAACKGIRKIIDDLLRFQKKS